MDDLFADDPCPIDTTLEIPVTSHLVFDIETGPCWLSDKIKDVRAYCEPLGIDFDLSSLGERPGKFDAAKHAHRISKKGGGRLVDPAKIKEATDVAARQHAAAVRKYEELATGADFWQNIQENATLTPYLGKILAIGYCRRGEVEIDDGGGDEAKMIDSFFRKFHEVASSNLVITGWNINGFDVPFICCRAAKLGVEIPRGVYQGKWLSKTFVDCMDRWQRSFNPWKQKSNSTGSAKNAAVFLGCSRPDDEIEGKEFWRYWIGGDQEKKLALRYLANDVTEESIIARALGVI